LGRAKRPSDEFISKLTANIRRLHPLADGHEELAQLCDQLINDIAVIDYNRSWYDGWNSFFGISHQQIAEGCADLAGSYAFYRNYGNGRVVLKSKLDISPFDQAAGVQTFKIRRKVVGPEERISEGFLFPLHGKIVMIAKIADAEGMLCIYAQKRRRGEDTLTGLMLSLREGDPAFATRIIMVKLGTKNKLSDANYGLIEFEKLAFELGNQLSAISNELDQWAVMQLLQLP
jgi:uncharacterized protein YjiS (DUF1127 family)